MSLKMYAYVLVILIFSVISNCQYLSCPLLGPDYPAPSNLQNDAQVIFASQNLSLQLDSLVKGNFTDFDGSTSFSIQWFAAETNQSLFQYHYTSPSVAQSSYGSHHITEDSIYRVGSISKLYTMYLFLAEAGDQFFLRPITDFVPELTLAARNSTANVSVNDVQWEDVTIGALASHMAGISRDDGQVDLLASPVAWSSLGFPSLTASELPSCGYNASVPACTRAVFLRDLIKQSPIFAPSTSPIYSNAAFALLSFALESITNKSFTDMMNNMYDQLGLGQTWYTTPSSAVEGVIPWNNSYSGWDIDLAAGNPAGSIYASTIDMTSLGRSILNNVLLSPALTRRWMKPLTFTSNMNLAVGAPWEIFRDQSSNRVIDYYTKSGDIGVYSSVLALIPDYNVGFTIFTADGSATNFAATLTDMIANTFGVALEAAAKAQAVGKFVGSYTAVDGTNSSVVIGSSDSFGLSVESWIGGGHDMFANLALTEGIDFSKVQILARLVPVNLESVHAKSNTSRLPFRAVFGIEAPVPSNIFSLGCATWTTVDALTYGGEALDEFVFEVNGEGAVTGLNLPALRVALGRVR